MKNSIFILMLKAAATAAIAFAAPLGYAADVNWSVTVGSPYAGGHMQVAPPVVYLPPQPVYVRPAPVYVQPARVVQYEQPYYVEVTPRRMKHRHWKRHHDKHHYRHDRHHSYHGH